MYIKCIRNFTSDRFYSLHSPSPPSSFVTFISRSSLFVYIDTSPRDSLDPHETQVDIRLLVKCASLRFTIRLLSHHPLPLLHTFSLFLIRFDLLSSFWNPEELFLGHFPSGKQSESSVFSSYVTNEEKKVQKKRGTKGMRNV